MRLTTQLLRSKVNGPLQSVEYIDLSNCDLAAIEKLNICRKLENLILRGNRIDDVEDIECLTELWQLDCSDNKIKSLVGLSRFVALGTLILSNNNLTWSELAKIRHMHILNLSLHGNPSLEKDPYYRIHVIDCLPNMWMLDGRIVTSAERLQVKHFFMDSALTDHPVRHKLSKEWFIPTSHKNIEVKGVFGRKATHLLTRFPTSGSSNIESDKRRLNYLAYNLQENLILEQKYTKRPLQVLDYRKSFLEDLLEARADGRERCNMILLLLVATLEFTMPTHLIKQTLETAKLEKLGNVYSIDLFYLPRNLRCSVASILLSAIKVDKDNHENGGLYDKLYLCLFYTIAELTKLSQSQASKSKSPYKNKSNSLYSDYKCLLAAEVVQLLCIVPSFFDYMAKDPGTKYLVTIATGDHDIIEQIDIKTKYLQNSKDNPLVLYQEISDLLIERIREHSLNYTNTVYKVKNSDQVLNNIRALPRKRPLTPAVISTFHMVGISSPITDSPQLSMTARNSQIERFPHLGDNVLLGSQMMGRIASLPQPFLALCYVDAVPDINGAMISKLKDPDNHYVYTHMSEFYWDSNQGYWRPKGTMGDRITIQNLPYQNDSVDLKSTSADQTVRPNTPESRPTTPERTTNSPVNVPTSVMSNSDIIQYHTEKQKPKPSRMPRPMSAVLMEKFDLKLNLGDASAVGSSDEGENAKTKKYQRIPPKSAKERHGSPTNRDRQQRRRPASHKMSSSQTRLSQQLDHCVQVTGLCSPPKGNENEVRHIFKSTDRLRSALRPASAYRPESRNIQRQPIADDKVIQDIAEINSIASPRQSLDSGSESELEDLPLESSRPATAMNQSTREGNVAPTDSEEKNRSDAKGEKAYRINVQLPESKEKESKLNGAGRNRRPGSSLARYSNRSTPVRSVVTPSRPFSAIDAYKHAVSKPIKLPQTESRTYTLYQKRCTDAWKKTTRTSNTVSPRPDSRQDDFGPRPMSTIDQLTTSNIHVAKANEWLAGGRNIYSEMKEKRPKSGHIPGWREGIPEKTQRPKSAASRALRRAKKPVITTPSSQAYETIYGFHSMRDPLPDMPQPSEYSPLYLHLGLPRRLGSPPPGSQGFFSQPDHSTVFSPGRHSTSDESGVRCPGCFFRSILEHYGVNTLAALTNEMENNLIDSEVNMKA